MHSDAARRGSRNKYLGAMAPDIEAPSSECHRIKAPSGVGCALPNPLDGLESTVSPQWGKTYFQGHRMLLFPPICPRN